MDPALKNMLITLDLLPIKLDEEAQEWHRRRGTDPSKLETHFSPGTPDQVIEEYARIRSNVMRLNGMDAAGESGSPDYISTEKQVWKDLCTRAADILTYILSRTKENKDEDTEVLKRIKEEGKIPVFEFSISSKIDSPREPIGGWIGIRYGVYETEINR